MSAAAVIDSLEFARAGDELHGSIAVAQMKRLDDVLFDTEGSLDYGLRGSRDERNRALLEVTVAGALHLQCQRCLGLLDYEVEIATPLLVVPRGAHLGDEIDDPEGPDVIEAEAELDVEGLIEDEVLLSLPLAPRHSEGECSSRLPQSESGHSASGAFARLAGLKNPHESS